MKDSIANKIEANSSVSVVIATYNRDQCLFDTCLSFLKQDYSNFEILIVDQSEVISEEKKRFYQAHPQIKIFQLDKPNRCRAKSFGVQKSSNEIVLICDDDIICPPNLISTHISHYKNPEIGGVTCRVVEAGLLDTDTRNVLRFSFYGRIHRNAHSTSSCFVEFPDGPNMSFRRNLFDKVGYFDERFIGTGIMEEPDLAIRVRRLGYKIFFDASTTVMHFPQSNGNVKIKKQNQATWYYNFLYNYSLYHIKNGIGYKLFLFLPFNLLLVLNVVVKNRFSLRTGLLIFKGYVDGFFYKNS